MIEGAHCLSPVYKIFKKNSFKISAKHKKDENFDFFFYFFWINAADMLARSSISDVFLPAREAKK